MMNSNCRLLRRAFLQIHKNCTRVQSTKFQVNELQRELKINFAAKTKIVTVENGDQIMKFPVTWLRDNCQCPKCFHSGSTSRVLDWQEAKVVKSLPTAIDVSNE